MKLTPDLKIGIRVLEWFKRKFSRRCFYCGVTLVTQAPPQGQPLPDNKLTCDHIYPRVKGGKDGKSNTIHACHKCNQQKRDMTLADFRQAIIGGKNPLFFGELMYREMRERAEKK
jgi:5-methylcytosine-specific restriction endonuclease McrA